MATQVMTLGLVAWAVVCGGLAIGARRASMVAAILLSCGLFTLVRTGGVTSDVIGSELHWRWTPTPEERLLARARDERPPLPPATTLAENPKPEAAKQPALKASTAPAALPSAPPAAKKEAVAVETAAEWPGFRGPNRDSVIRGVRIETDWSKSPPAAIWRRPIGPGWSSFAVQGDLIYTQEQRGDDEIVACYKLSTGEPVWQHKDAVRFWESNGGAGPRATPTLSDGRVYALGATGIVNVLDQEPPLTQLQHQNETIPPGVEKDPLVSVILPVYNGEKFVGQTIESALRQTTATQTQRAATEDQQDRARCKRPNFSERRIFHRTCVQGEAETVKIHRLRLASRGQGGRRSGLPKHDQRAGRGARNGRSVAEPLVSECGIACRRHCECGWLPSLDGHPLWLGRNNRGACRGWTRVDADVVEKPPLRSNCHIGADPPAKPNCLAGQRRQIQSRLAPLQRGARKARSPRQRVAPSCVDDCVLPVPAVCQAERVDPCGSVVGGVLDDAPVVRLAG
jgi:hypothetical protein